MIISHLWYENCLGINEFAVLSGRRKSIMRDYDGALKNMTGRLRVNYNV